MGESNRTITMGCADNRTAKPLGDCDPDRARGSLASTADYWYIDNKGMRLEQMLRKASCR